MSNFEVEEFHSFISYNQPKFSPYAIWSGNAITFATSTTVGVEPFGIFVDKNNTVYVANRGDNKIQIWLEGSTTPSRTITTDVGYTYSIFATVTGDIYIDNGYSYKRVDKYTSNGTIRTSVMSVKYICYDIFIDVSNNLYCSLYDYHQVAMTSLNNNSTMWTIGAGTYYTSLNLYVADCGNNRVQLFQSGQLVATTIAGASAAGTISLSCPTFSFNQPKFCPSATWYTDGVTFADTRILNTYVYGVFVDVNNTVYIPSWLNDQSYVWREGSILPDRNLTGGMDGSLSIFATLSGDIYLDNGLSYGRVDKWGPSSTSGISAMTITAQCYDLFVDTTNTLYCSMTGSHRVAKKWLSNNDTTNTIAAGTGGASSAASDLYYPCGIYVDYQFNLYVGDCGNDRIQMFPLGQMNAITIAGNGAPGTFTFDCPNDIAFDGNGYLFVTDNYNNRLIGSGPYGFRCLFGCTKVAGSSSSQLNSPREFSFDSYGNIFVADQVNYRVQKFLLASNSCSISYNQPNFCFDASWFANASTFASSTTIGSLPYGIFIDGINTVYVASQSNNIVLIWSQYDSTPTRNNSGNLNRPYSTFVSLAGDVYVDNGYANGRVDKFSFNSSIVTTVMKVNGSCYGLFVDSNNSLYCSLRDIHQVVQVSLNNGTSIPWVILGNGSAGSASNMLSFPQGIYVDSNMNLYVADCGNDRIQRMSAIGQMSAETVVGNGSSSGDMTLRCPSGVVMDKSGYLFIVDMQHNPVPQLARLPPHPVQHPLQRPRARPVRRLPPHPVHPPSRLARPPPHSARLLRRLPPRPVHSLSHPVQHPLQRPRARPVRRLPPHPVHPPSRLARPPPHSARLLRRLPPRPLHPLQRPPVLLPPRPVHSLSHPVQHPLQRPRARPVRRLPPRPVRPPSRLARPLRRLPPHPVHPLQRPPVLLSPRPPAHSPPRLARPPPHSARLLARPLHPLQHPPQHLLHLLRLPVYDPMSTTTSVTTTEEFKVCYSPTITLIPGGSSLTSPLQYRRNQDFSISSTIQFRCNASLTTLIQWSVKNCTSTSCLYRIGLSDKIRTTLSEFYAPSRTFAYGMYELTLTVSMKQFPSAKSSSSVHVMITPSGITANPVPLGTSMITRGKEQDLELDPGSYSVDPDEDAFDASKWKYDYYCRWYGSYNFPNSQGRLLTIENSKSDPLNPSCLSDRSDNGTGLIFGNLTSSPKSSLTLLSGTLQSNQMYQFMVYMENRKNASIQATGFVTVTIEDTLPKLVVIGCVISTLCSPNLEFQLVNPTTQVALFAFCVGVCENLVDIHWNIYKSDSNSSSNSTQWTLFDRMITYENIWFFGSNTSNFTASYRLFVDNPSIRLWRFEVVYQFANESSTSALNFVINQSPSNGSCTMNPKNGTTTSSFTVSCPNWYDEDGVKDYSLYVWTSDISKKVMVAFSSVSQFQVRLPAGDEQTSLLHMIIYVRDLVDCVTEVNMSSVQVIVDSVSMNDLMSNVQMSSSDAALSNNPMVQLLSSGNQNVVGQVLTSLSQQLNQMESESSEKAISNGVPAASVSISSLGSSNSGGNGSVTSSSVNASALAEYSKEVNSQANMRDYVISYVTNLAITTSNSIKLQASTLAQMTQSTNQLTRSALTVASNRCYDLAVVLYSMAQKIPYEDVEVAANQLIQCASNILTSVNGPLQERTLSLDLDMSRANAISTDYDTDIESEWSSISSSDSTDSSSIEQRRNLYYQKKLANEIQVQSTQIISFVTSSLNIHLNVGQNLLMNTSQTFMSLETISIESLSNKTIKQVGSASFYLPSQFTLNTTDHHSSFSLRSKMDPLAVNGNFSNTNLSRSVALTFVDNNGNEIPFSTNRSTPIKVIIPRDPSIIISSMYLQNVTTSVNKTTSDHVLFHLHYINITSSLSISVHFEIRSLNESLGYLFIYKFDQAPQLNSSIKSIDGWTMFCPSMLNDEKMYKYYIDNEKTSDHQSLIFGIRELSILEMNEYCWNNKTLDNSSVPVTDIECNFTSNYELRIYTSGCYYLDENNNWKSEGLVVGPLTNHYETECLSNHLTTFAGGFIVLPAPINWSYVFANADFMKNKTVYLTMICTSVLYIILMIYGRFKDKKDIEKLGVTPLGDNRRSDQYYYQILVFTGQRTNAGTESKVHFVLSGDDDQTEIRALADPHRKIFQRGGIDAFVMAVPKSLGLLNYIRIWHDNSGAGSSASWYLKYIIVRDLETMEKFYFIAQKWLAVEQDDGRIERILPVAGEMEKQEFSYVLSKKAYHSVSDGHLWFSIFSRPPSNRFTRVQRCTCCFVLFFVSMLLNIMYYDLSNEAKSANQTQTNGLVIGPLYITPQQIGIGVMVELLTLIPSLFIVQFFRRIRSRQQTSPLRQALHKINASRAFSESVESTRRKKQPRTLPWWCLFIAYGLSFAIIAISILFIIARGIEFGDVKTQQWLTSVLTGFFSSILLTQPIKILCLAVFFALFCRNSTNDKEASEYIDDDRIEFDDTGDNDLHGSENHGIFNPQTMKSAKRLNENEIRDAREQRLKEMQMWSIIHEFLIYVIFATLIFLITYGNREANSFHQVNHLRSYLFNTRQSSVDYTKILTIEQYWNWLENSFVDNLRAQQWYNGDAARYLNGYLNDKSNRLIGWAMMRQLRIKTELCDDQRLITRCEHSYSIFNEDKRSFEPGWINETTMVTMSGGKYSSSIMKAFRYRSSDELDTYAYVGEHETYRGGGYVYEFRGSLSDMKKNLSQLHQLEWIDSKTRAVFIQMTLYNPNVKLLTSVTLLTEFLLTGGVFPSARFDPINFYTFTSVLQIVCTILCMLFIIYFMKVEIQSVIQLKTRYFRQFWSIIQIGIIVCSWTSVGVYIWRFRESARVSNLFEKTNGYVYINLQLAAYVNDILTYLLGYCCFFGMIKFVHFFRFNHRVSLFTETLRIAANELIQFFLMFSIVYMSYLTLFYLLFVSKLSSCSSLLSTAQMLFEITLMKFDATELIEAGAFLGPFCFTLFIFVVVFVCLSMFLSIINDSFRRAKETRIEDQIILSFMWKKFIQYTGLRKRSQSEVYAERDRRMRSLFFDPIEHFPRKIDELLAAIDRIYMDQRAEFSRLRSADV
ncbi:hypothetical protein I4U23_013322 [Adineta vaga]|nr:hypothetical protein I4U23_013322 [Adineta vaga]